MVYNTSGKIPRRSLGIHDETVTMTSNLKHYTQTIQRYKLHEKLKPTDVIERPKNNTYSFEIKYKISCDT